MDESMNLFRVLTNKSEFRDLPWIILLNKVDDFAERIKEVAVKTIYPGFDGDEDCS